MAGKAARKRKHGDKMARRRAEKAARKAKYLSLAGTSNKNKRKKGQAGSGHKHEHIMANCGNVGCERCFPELNS